MRASAEAAVSQSKQPHYAHIPAEQLESVRKEAQAALAWLDDKETQQEKLAKCDPPAFLAQECTKKGEALERFARPIFATPKPAPPPEAMEEGGPSAVKAEDLD